MAAVNTICTDKTGTLTKNILVLTDIWVNKETFEIPEPDDDKLFGDSKDKFGLGKGNVAI